MRERGHLVLLSKITAGTFVVIHFLLSFYFHKWLSSFYVYVWKGTTDSQSHIRDSILCLPGRLANATCRFIFTSKPIQPPCKVEYVSLSSSYGCEKGREVGFYICGLRRLRFGWGFLILLEKGLEFRVSRGKGLDIWFLRDAQIYIRQDFP